MEKILSITKKEAVSVFGSVNEMAELIGVNQSAISQWPDQLNKRQQNEVFGVIYRLNLRRRFNQVVAERPIS